LDGSGYHRGCRAQNISVACRVLAAADAFHAMTQNRPYREALTAEQAGAVLVKDSRAGRLDPVVVGAVLDAAGQGR
jgi:HD-GYP domain-containing protein (c-di-GMP phosphodiesterase class II)